MKTGIGTSHAWTYGLVAGMLVAGAIALQASAWRGSTQLHTLTELAATLVALFTGTVALLRYFSKRNNTYLFLGAGFVGTAFLDGYHAIVSSSYFREQFPSPPPSLIPWSWNASRTFLAILMMLTWWAARREQRLGEEGRISEKAIFVGVTILTLASFCLFAFVPLPPAYYPELFFGRPHEFLAGVFFLIALIGFLQRDNWQTGSIEHWLVLSLIVAFVSQSVAMSRSFGLFDAMFDVAHLLKIAGYLCVLFGLLSSTYQLFVRAETARRELTKQAAELERSNKELDDFAYVASHDLKAPLRGISHLVSWINEDAGDVLPEKSRGHLVKMQSRVDRLERLLEDLLDYSRAGRVNGDVAATDTAALVRSAFFLFDPPDGFQLNVAESLPTFKTHRVPLEQVFRNLIQNAIKHHDRADGCIEVSSQDVGEFVEFTVSDDGPGIELQFHEKVFSMFQTLKPRDQAEGSGMGLAVVRKTIESQGGKIQIASAGRGTTFRFTWPGDIRNDEQT